LIRLSASTSTNVQPAARVDPGVAPVQELAVPLGPSSHVLGELTVAPGPVARCSPPDLGCPGSAAPVPAKRLRVAACAASSAAASLAGHVGSLLRWRGLLVVRALVFVYPLDVRSCFGRDGEADAGDVFEDGPAVCEVEGERGV